MPDYNLRRESDYVIFDPVHASDDKNAVAKFSVQLSINFTLEDGLVEAPYMMSRHDKRAAGDPVPWTKYDTSVWTKDSTISN